jgi:hypothetical protein
MNVTSVLIPELEPQTVENVHQLTSMIKSMLIVNIVMLITINVKNVTTTIVSNVKKTELLHIVPVHTVPSNNTLKKKMISSVLIVTQFVKLVLVPGITVTSVLLQESIQTYVNAHQVYMITVPELLIVSHVMTDVQPVFTKITIVNSVLKTESTHQNVHVKMVWLKT